jgi:hypothetical protein
MLSKQTNKTKKYPLTVCSIFVCVMQLFAVIGVQMEYQSAKHSYNDSNIAESKLLDKLINLNFSLNTDTVMS